MSTLDSLYYPTKDLFTWSGRLDAKPNEYVYQIVQYLDLDNPCLVDNSLHGFALLGFESDTGVSRNLGNVGAKEGPFAFRQALAKMPFHQPFVLYDAGNVRCINDDLEAAQVELGLRVAMILSLGLKPIVIGGGHETAWGHFQGIIKNYPDNIAILNFDAHFDLRPQVNDKFGSSGTPFRQINEYLKNKHQPFHYYCAGIQPNSNIKSLFKYAHENNVQYLLAENINANPYDLSWIKTIIKKHKHIYVTICLDVFIASMAPGVSAPQVLGINATYVMEALKLLRQSNCVVSLDIVELAPKYDIRHQTAALAAALFIEYCAGFKKLDFDNL